MANTTFTKLPTADELLKQAAAKAKDTLGFVTDKPAPKSETSLEDMLRDGYTMDELASTFMTQLREAQKKVEDEKVKAAAEAKAKADTVQAESATTTAETATDNDLSVLREDLAVTMFEYLTEIGVLSEDLDAESTIDTIEETLAEVENKYEERRRRNKDAFTMLKTLFDLFS